MSSYSNILRRAWVQQSSNNIKTSKMQKMQKNSSQKEIKIKEQGMF